MILRSATILSLVAAAAVAAPARAQGVDDPTARYRRPPVEESRRGNEPSIQAIEPDEPIAEPAPNGKPAVVVAPEPALRAPGVDRPAARANGLALPDEYLDPAFPTDGSEARIPPAQSDNVQEVPLEDGQLDGAEREEADHYKEALGQYKDPEEFTEDNWGNDPAQRTRQGDVEEYEDPAEW